ncbi:MAG: hypothetical protein LBG27_13640 [Spirochaetaceae bacterium]|jgi:hypothetical protein|nr:hypothetical protein [Spirochaetaceae bacterium]
MEISGYIENGQFVPDSPLAFEGRTRAVLRVADHAAISVEENHWAWGKFLDAIQNIDEKLPGMPERLQFRTPEEIDRL